MSGGHWDYLSHKLIDRAEELGHAKEAFYLLAAIEHELDWGLSCDTCRECAKLRTVAALIQFFNDSAYKADAAMAIARDHKQNMCSKCEEREKARK